MIPPETIEEIRAATDISEIVRESGLEIRKRSGSELSALCPFHQEKTPSFTVTERKQFYHCFGCATHGDAFRFLMEYQGMGFKDAAMYLAERAGIAIDQDGSEAARRAMQHAKQRKIGAIEAHFTQEALLIMIAMNTEGPWKAKDGERLNTAKARVVSGIKKLYPLAGVTPLDRDPHDCLNILRVATQQRTAERRQGRELRSLHHQRLEYPLEPFGPEIPAAAATLKWLSARKVH